MKKATLILVLAAFGLAVSAGRARAQGSIFLNNYDSGFGVFQGPGTTPAPAGYFYQILGGVDATSLSPIATANPGNASTFTFQAGDINGNGPNSGTFFDQGYGFVAGVAPGAVGSFQVIAWQSGFASYAAALAGGGLHGASSVWTEATGTHPPLPALPSPTVLNLPGQIHMVPEPSAIALGVLGAAALFLRRRK